MTTAAPDIPVQIAHLAGGGSPDDAAADVALGVFVDAIKQTKESGTDYSYSHCSRSPRAPIWYPADCH
jgi:hypothetical protein